MNLEFICKHCKKSFTFRVISLLEEPESLTCPGCQSTPSKNILEDFRNAFQDLLKVVSEIRDVFSLECFVESDAIPKPYGFDDGYSIENELLKKANQNPLKLQHPTKEDDLNTLDD